MVVKCCLCDIDIPENEHVKALYHDIHRGCLGILFSENTTSFVCDHKNPNNSKSTGRFKALERKKINEILKLEKEQIIDFYDNSLDECFYGSPLITIELIKKNSNILNKIPKYVFNDKQFVIEFFKNTFNIYDFLTKTIEDDINIKFHLMNIDNDTSDVLLVLSNDDLSDDKLDADELHNINVNKKCISEAMNEHIKFYNSLKQNYFVNKQLILYMLKKKHNIYDKLDEIYKLDNDIIKTTCEIDVDFDFNYMSKYIIGKDTAFIFDLMYVNDKLLHVLFNEKYGMNNSHVKQYFVHCINKCQSEHMIKRNIAYRQQMFPDCEYLNCAINIIKNNFNINIWRNYEKDKKMFVFSIIFRLLQQFNCAYICLSYVNPNVFSKNDNLFGWSIVLNENFSINHIHIIDKQLKHKNKYIQSVCYFTCGHAIFEKDRTSANSRKYFSKAIELNPLNMYAVINISQYDNNIVYYENALQIALKQNNKQFYKIIFADLLHFEILPRCYYDTFKKFHKITDLAKKKEESKNEFQKLIKKYTNNVHFNDGHFKYFLAELIYFVKGTDNERNAWYYVLVDPNNITKFKIALDDKIIHLEEHSIILSSGYGDNPPEKNTILTKTQFNIGKHGDLNYGTIANELYDAINSE